MNKVDFLIRETLKAKYNLETAEYGDCLDDEGRDVGIYFLDCCKELAKTGEQKALLCLLDFFEDEFDIKYEGALERLMNCIENNFTEKQIIDSFYEKFSRLLDKNFWRSVYIVEPLIYNKELFEEFRKVFNTVKSPVSEKFLDKFLKIRPIYEKEISILREDMKKW